MSGNSLLDKFKYFTSPSYTINFYRAYHFLSPTLGGFFFLLSLYLVNDILRRNMFLILEITVNYLFVQTSFISGVTVGCLWQEDAANIRLKALTIKTPASSQGCLQYLHTANKEKEAMITTQIISCLQCGNVFTVTVQILQLQCKYYLSLRGL